MIRPSHIHCDSNSTNPRSEFLSEANPYQGDTMSFDPKPIDPGPAPVDPNSI